MSGNDLLFDREGVNGEQFGAVVHHRKSVFAGSCREGVDEATAMQYQSYFDGSRNTSIGGAWTLVNSFSSKKQGGLQQYVVIYQPWWILPQRTLVPEGGPSPHSGQLPGYPQPMIWNSRGAYDH